MVAAGVAPGSIIPPPPGFARSSSLSGPDHGTFENWRKQLASGEASLTFGTWSGPADWIDTTGWNLGDSAAPLVLSLRGGSEVRWGHSSLTRAFEGGVRAWGSKGNLAFSSEVRSIVESHSDPNAASYDREFVDRTVEGELSDYSFTSYARYRAAIDWHSTVGVFGFRRDALHWGPGRWSNLVLNKAAIPYPSFRWAANFGNASLETVYGKLSRGANGAYSDDGSSKTLYAHRYEWRAAPWLAIGSSEALVVSGKETPAALLPIVPLFVEKGSGLESANNGLIGFDIAIRGHDGLLYGEFLVDDLQEPSRLFDNYWGNRWAAMAGFEQWWMLPGGLNLDYALEWARIEPWVYAHYKANSSQISNLSSPLGNPSGPNSRTIHSEIGVGGDSWRISAGTTLAWKGIGPGSSLNDTAARLSLTRMERKSFLSGIDEPDITPAFEAWYRWGHISALLHLDSSPSGVQFRAHLLGWI